MEVYYKQDYTKEQINEVLNKIKDCIINNNYTISLNRNRQENIKFINEYNIRSVKQKNILLSIKVEDFCYTLQNIKIGYEHEVLYVFVPQVKLFNADDIEEMVNVYIKFNLIDKSNENYAVVISFYRLNKTINYMCKLVLVRK